MKKPLKPAETLASLKARTYPSQMSTAPGPDAPHVRAIVGPNRSSSASLSFGYEGR